MNQRLFRLRQSLGYNQDEFAQLLGIAIRSYIRYEKGERTVPADILATIGELGVNLNWLLTGQGAMWKKTDQPAAVAEAESPYENNSREVQLEELAQELARLKRLLHQIEALLHTLQDAPPS